MVDTSRGEMTAFGDAFLVDHDPRKWSAPTGTPKSLTPSVFFLGRGDHALEVALASCKERPKADDVRALWRARQGRRPSPLLLVVREEDGSGGHASVCGPVGESPPLLPDVEMSQIERLCAAALDEPSRHAAVRFLLGMLPEIGSDLPGLRNSGLLATQELRHGVPSRGDWTAARTKGRELLTLRGRGLIERLGFGVEQLSTTASVLTINGTKRAVAVFLDEGEAFEDSGERFGTSPVSHALALADREGLPWVVLTRARQIRLYAARIDTGVGRKGRAETFVEANLALLPEELAGYLPLLFGANALVEHGTIEEILSRSADFAADLGVRLRVRVYYDMIPLLAKAVARHLHTGGALTEGDLSAAYEETLVILFRLLFVAYAEDKDLLPYRTNSRYHDHSLKLLAHRLSEWQQPGPPRFDEQATDLWDDVRALWTAVDLGNVGWGVPQYNGGLFSSDPNVSKPGAALSRLRLTDAEFGPPLGALLVDATQEGVLGPVDFRSLSVREFGTIYEGLLESTLSVAPSDLGVDQRGNYVPARRKADAVVLAGEVYFHHRSGSRKATGSYFTKAFAVEHLLDHALEPALEEHIERLRTLTEASDEAAATEAFFDFRCVDLAMGSGHFLVAAVDRIETRLSGFLALNPIPRVLAELDELRAAAVGALGELADGVEIETTSLLRRQVARRCTYGVDLNGMAVELARLGVWIHTFVPGLPLSFLDHNLVEGNSLTGIGTLEEAVEILDPDARKSGQLSVFHGTLTAFLGRAEKALRRLATTSEANSRDIAAARTAHQEALAAVEPARQLLDVLVAARLGETTVPVVVDEDAVATHPGLAAARRLSEHLRPVHFPVVFPEVFLRERSGFDCVIGNPPWDKVRFEPQQFWVVRAPGLRALNEAGQKAEMTRLRELYPMEAAAEQEEAETRAQIQQLVEHAFELQGRGQHGHHDFAKLFLERALSLLGDHGSLGYVLPRTAMVLAGWTDLRRAAMADHTLRTLQARNRAGWLFEDVHQSIAVVLCSRVAGSEGVLIWPDVEDVRTLREASDKSAIILSRKQIELLTDKSVIPWFSGPRDRPVFDRLLTCARLGRRDGWVSGTADSSRWDFSTTGPHHRFTSTVEAPASWRVLMSRHVDAYRIADEDRFQRYVVEPARLAELGLGVSVRDGQAVLDDVHPVIVYRYPSRSDDSRTLIATVLPEKGYLYSKGYVHGVRVPSETSDVAILALLGVLNSLACDWWVRRFVDRHVTKQVIDNIPLPAWDQAEQAEVASHAAALVAEHGVTTVAGERWLDTIIEPGSAGVEHLLAIEASVLTGYGLGRADIKEILLDFNAQGAPPEFRSELIAKVAR
jgi:hypothetical protein